MLKSLVVHLDRLFQLSANGTTVQREATAGLTTFSTMAYIIFVNPAVLAAAGMDTGAVMVATILSSAAATLIMALYANYPFALAPGMGLNAYFAYSIVLGEGISWQVALGATFLAGSLFLVLNILQIRALIMEAIPKPLRLSLTGGIGLFLAFIGLQSIRLVVPHPETMVTVGDLATPEALLAGIGLVIASVLFARGFKAAILISIMTTWALGLLWGLVEWNGLIAMPPDPWPTLLQMDLPGAFTAQLGSIILAFASIAVFDAAGTLTSLAEQGGFVDKNGKVPRLNRIFMADAVGTMLSGLFGTSPMTTYVESAAGVTAGGRTGLTALVVALLFLVCLWFAPLASSIPMYSTAPALILIGALLLAPIKDLPWEDPIELIPCFVVLIAVPLTFSISTGIALGLILFPLSKLFVGRARDVHWLAWVLGALFIAKFLWMDKAA